MKNAAPGPSAVAWAVAVLLLDVMATPALSHHSLAMYDQTTKRTLTGKLTQLIPGSSHAQLLFDVLESDGQPVMQNGKPVQWGVETGSATAIARQGVSAKLFPDGTIFTVTLYQLRDGRPFGALAGLLIKCGATMPAGGCTEKTGQVLISEGRLR